MTKYVEKTRPEVQAELNRRLMAELQAAPERYAELLEDAEGEEAIREALEEMSRRMIEDAERVAAEYLDELRAEAVELED